VTAWADRGAVFADRQGRSFNNRAEGGCDSQDFGYRKGALARDKAPVFMIYS
jgi:hypothetical protein